MKGRIVKTSLEVITVPTRIFPFGLQWPRKQRSAKNKSEPFDPNILLTHAVVG
jgi:hypothetical protein